MRPFKKHVMDALKLIEPLTLKQIAPTHGPILRERPRRYVTHYRELSTSSLTHEIGSDDHSLVIFYMSSYGNTARMAEEISQGAGSVEGVRVSIYDLEGGETDPFVDLIEEADALLFGSPHHQRRCGEACMGSALVTGGGQPERKARRCIRLLRMER
jgi:flavorubredoxin